MSDKRLQDFIQTKGTDEKVAVQLIPFPSDEGVKRNGGRPGAAGAPELILEHLLKLTPHPAYFNQHCKLLSSASISKPVSCSGNVENDQEKLGQIVGNTFQSNAIPVIIGGGHETSFGHFLGYVQSKIPVSILNLDAHTDVRNLKNGQVHSGSPFRQAIEHPSGICTSYNVLGLNPASVAQDHYNFVNKQGKALFESDLNLMALQDFLEQDNANTFMATMDMDVVRQSDAPGVSAPNSSGISGSHWLNYAHEIGKCRAVRSFDICEVNPTYDHDNQTVKLAALTIWNFLLGLSLR